MLLSLLYSYCVINRSNVPTLFVKSESVAGIVVVMFTVLVPSPEGIYGVAIDKVSTNVELIEIAAPVWS